MAWEKIAHNTYRMKVPGGWVIKSELFNGSNSPGTSCSVGMIFISDEHHGWGI